MAGSPDDVFTSQPPQYRPGLQQGPFSDYLQPRPIDQPISPATGWENAPTAAGKLALNFLQGVREERVARAREEDYNAQKQLDNYRQQIYTMAQNPDLTEEGRQALLQEANSTLNQHMQYEMRDVPKHGVGGFLKNLLINAAGGPIKTREPIDWDAAMGRAANIVTGASQKANFNNAVQEAQQKISALKQTNPNPSAEDVERAIGDTFSRVVQSAPNYVQAFQATVGVPMGATYQPAGSLQYQMQELTRNTPIQPTEAPPEPPQNFTPIGGYSPMAPAMTTPPPGTAPAPAGQAVVYEPGYGPQRFAALSMVAGHQGSPIQISQPKLVTSGGKRMMATMVFGSPNPADNGYWDASTQRKISSPVTAESVTTSNGITDERGFEMHYDPSQGRYVYTPGPDGQPFRRGYAPVPVVGADGQIRYVSRGEAGGQVAGSQGMLDRRTAQERAKERSAAIVAADNRLQSRNIETNRALNAAAVAVQKGSIDIAVQGLSSLGIPVDPSVVQQAMKNPKPLLDVIEAQRQKALADNQRAWQQERGTIDQNYPAQTTAPPPGTGAAPPATQAPPQSSGGARVAIPPAASFDSMIAH